MAFSLKQAVQQWCKTNTIQAVQNCKSWWHVRVQNCNLKLPSNVSYVKKSEILFEVWLIKKLIVGFWDDQLIAH